MTDHKPTASNKKVFSKAEAEEIIQKELVEFWDSDEAKEQFFEQIKSPLAEADMAVLINKHLPNI